MTLEEFKRYEGLLKKLKSGKIHAIVFAADHGDPWHHQAINEFLEWAKKKGIPIQLLEESLNEERLRKKEHLQKLTLAEELSKMAKKYGVVDKPIHTLSMHEAIHAEQKALDLAVNKLEQGKKKDAILLQNIAKAISKFRKSPVRERYMVFERQKRWSAWAADSGTLKDMMQIAVRAGYNYEPLWRSRNLTMVKNIVKARAVGKIPVLVTGTLHAEDIRKIAEKRGIRVAIVRPKSAASTEEKWIEKRNYKKFIKGGNSQ